MKTRAAIFLLGSISAARLFAQTPLPSTFVTAGVQYSSRANPHYLGWIAGAQLIGQGAYSFSGVYATAQGGKLQTSITTGIAPHLADVAGIGLYGIGGAGMATTSSATNTGPTTIGLALNGGVMAVKPIKNGYSINVIAQAIRGGGINVGIGFGWSK